MKSHIDILREGAALARRSMHADAMEWRLLCSIGAKEEFRREMLDRAIQARDVARKLSRAADEALSQEVGF